MDRGAKQSEEGIVGERSGYRVFVLGGMVSVRLRKGVQVAT